MRIIYKKIMMILLVFVSVIGLAACQSSDANLTDVKNALEIGLNENSSLNEVTTNLTLPTTVEGFEDVVITWESSNEEVITITGVVTQLEDDTNVLLTAIITLDALSDEKEFSITVLGFELDEEDPDEDEDPDELDEEAILDLIQEDIDAIESINVVDLRVNVPTIGAINGSNIIWTYSALNITSQGIVIPNKVKNNSHVGRANATFVLHGYTVQKTYEVELPTNENTIINSKSEVPFVNMTTEYNVLADSLNIYHNNNGLVPYVSVVEFVDFLKGLIDPEVEFTTSVNNGILELQYEYVDSETEEVYELLLTANSNDNTLSTNDSGFFYGYIKSTETNYGRNISYDRNSELNHYLSSEGYHLELGNYGFSVIEYQEDILIPFYVANLLFANSNYYSVHYNQDQLTGLYFAPSRNSNEERAILNSSFKGTSPTTDLLVHNFNFMAFFFDNFYGLKDYQEVNTYYDLLFSRKNLLMSSNINTIDTAIFDYINKDIDELHTSFGTRSYYHAANSTGPLLTVVTQLGRNVMDFYMQGLFPLEDVMDLKWGNEERPSYWMIDDDILVVTLDGFYTSDIEETTSWNDGIVQKILKTEATNLIPSFNNGSRYIYFNNSEDELSLMEVLIKGVNQSDLLLYHDELELAGFNYFVENEESTPLFKEHGYYVKTVDDITYMVQVIYDEDFEVVYVSLGDDAPVEFSGDWPYYPDVESLIEDDSAIYLEFHIEKALREMPTITNAVLDITYNTGGNVGALYRVIGMLFNKPFIVSNFDPTLGEQSTRVVTTTPPVSFDNLNWYLLTSPISYSAANMMPTIVKHNQLAPIIGRQSAGGAASVTPVYLPIGTIIQASSSNVSAYVTGSNTEESPYVYHINEDGIEPDILILLSQIYNEEILRAAIENN